MSVEILSNPGRRYPERVESRAAGLGCRYFSIQPSLDNHDLGDCESSLKSY